MIVFKGLYTVLLKLCPRGQPLEGEQKKPEEVLYLWGLGGRKTPSMIGDTFPHIKLMSGRISGRKLLPE